MGDTLFERHRKTLERACDALRSRDYWSPYAEVPSGKIYGETAAADGQQAFKAHLHNAFPLSLPGQQGEVGNEHSPYGMALGVRYPAVDPELLLPAMIETLPVWRDLGVEGRLGICLEVLSRLNQRSFEIAHAVMHTTGQGFMMAFQAGGAHAQDRALEALAYAFEEMRRTPSEARWSKPQGKHEPLQLDKRFHIAPRGIGLVIGCATFPTWNSYPGLFASLATGNPVVVKPHPGAILPLAITVSVFHEVLTEAGLPTHIVALAADSVEAPHTMELALRPEIKLIDYTGGSAFGNWLQENARQAQVFAEQAGVNSVIIDGTDDVKGMVRNLAFSLSLYAGQMCTTPQNLYIPRDGIDTPEGHLSADAVCQAIASGVQKFLSDPQRATEVLGAIQSSATLARISQAAGLGEVLLASEAPEHPRFPEARIRTPLLLRVDAAHADPAGEEWFGPIVFLVISDCTAQSIAMARELAEQRGAMTWGVYSRDETVLDQVEQAALQAGVALSCNLTGGVFVNQSAAFSDFHGTSGNPACSACLSDGDFVASRFRVVQSRRPAVA